MTTPHEFFIHGIIGKIYNIVNVILNSNPRLYSNKPIIIFPIYLFNNYRNDNKFTYHTVKFSVDDSEAIYIKRNGDFYINNYLVVAIWWYLYSAGYATVYNIIGSF